MIHKETLSISIKTYLLFVSRVAIIQIYVKQNLVLCVLNKVRDKEHNKSKNKIMDTSDDEKWEDFFGKSKISF